MKSISVSPEHLLCGAGSRYIGVPVSLNSVASKVTGCGNTDFSSPSKSLMNDFSDLGS